MTMSPTLAGHDGIARIGWKLITNYVTVGTLTVEEAERSRWCNSLQNRRAGPVDYPDFEYP